VGFGFAGTWPGGESHALLEADIGVMRTHRRKGAGSALFRALSEHARGLGHTGFQFEVFEDRADALDFLHQRGYAEVGRELQFELDLVDAAPPSRELPAGFEIVTRAQRPDLVPGMYEVAVEAGPDIPGSEGGQGSFEDWHAFEIERAINLPENCFIAVHQDEAVGFATLQVFEGDTAHHGATLVKRAFRERGIARALTLRQIEAARAAGFGRLHCETEARNEPMRRLLEQLGYGAPPSVIELQGPLATEHASRR
jgi:GNAT superfamily N-acetyltransferase